MSISGIPGYFISSKIDQNLSITPNEYIRFVQVLDDATLQSDWGTSINLNLIFNQANYSPIQKTLTLNEIIRAVKQVPLPVDFYTRAAQVGTVALAAGAIGVGAYLANNAYTNGQPIALPVSKSEEKSILANNAGQPIDLPVSKSEEESILANNAGKPIDLPVSKSEEESSHATALEEADPAKKYDEWKWANVRADAFDALFGDESKTVSNWQGGGDAELYSAPGLSGQEYIDAASLLGVGQLAGNLGKAAALGVVQLVGNLGKTAATAIGSKLTGNIASGVDLGLASAAKYGTNAAGATDKLAKEAFLANTNRVLALPAPAPRLALPAPAPRLALPAQGSSVVKSPLNPINPNYIAPKNISPTWGPHFGQ